MVIVMKQHATDSQIEGVIEKLVSQGFDVHRSTGVERTILGAVGAKVVDTRDYELVEGVQEVHRITQPYKLASRAFRPQGTVIEIKDVKIGGEETVIMAGPCTIENYEQCNLIGERIKAAGAKVIRGGAFKPRTSPYSFQGHGEEGLKSIRKAADNHGLLVISEIMESSQLPLAQEYIDIIQIGARNMQNYGLLRDIGRTDIPALLKRGMSATINDLLLAAEYIMAEGNHRVILCERGIRTFETHTRNTLDISAIPVIHELSHLPVVVDPSHASGIRDKVPPLARAAVAAGADGLLLEVHHDPDNAICDGAQTMTLEQFDELMEELRVIAGAVGRKTAGAADPKRAVTADRRPLTTVSGLRSAEIQNSKFQITAGRPAEILIPKS
ncbi:MAG: 3-deoxy-7-phosphoheptulonate synthase [Acidobacteria bacterium]|nr:3-deoxy-7-phosphoheptulonate synthase [Acidobacteriota bacterium]